MTQISFSCIHTNYSEEKNHKPMAKQNEKGKMKQKEFETGDRTPMKDVFITVYVESSIKGSHQNSNNPSRKLEASQFTNRKHKPIANNFYDRRAQLLAYAKELREASSPDKVKWPTRLKKTSPGHRSKKQRQERWTKIPKQIQRSFRVMLDGTKRRLNYERIRSEDDTQRKKKRTWRVNANFCKRLVCMLKQVSRGWGCNKGV